VRLRIGSMLLSFFASIVIPYLKEANSNLKINFYFAFIVSLYSAIVWVVNETLHVRVSSYQKADLSTNNNKSRIPYFNANVCCFTLGCWKNCCMKLVHSKLFLNVLYTCQIHTRCSNSLNHKSIRVLFHQSASPKSTWRFT